jgi:hypothetical protein
LPNAVNRSQLAPTLPGHYESVDFQKILRYFPDRHEQEFRELIEVTAPHLLALERAGKLRGWRP